MAEMIVSAKTRSDFGSAAARRLRRGGMVPAVVYGGSGDTRPVSLDPKEILRVLRSDTGRNTILTIDIDGSSTDSVILKDWQVDPVRESILHADFQRIAMDQVLRVTVPISIRGEAPGVKTEGGLLDLVLRELEVECLPADIPERIEVDVSGLQLHQSVRVRDLPPIERVEVLEEADRVIVHVETIRAEETPAEAEAEEAAVVEGAEGEPEVIAKGKKEDEDKDKD